MTKPGTFLYFLDKGTIRFCETYRPPPPTKTVLFRKESKQSLGLGNKLVKVYKACLYTLCLWILFILVIRMSLSLEEKEHLPDGVYLLLLGGQRSQHFLLAWAGS